MRKIISTVFLLAGAVSMIVMSLHYFFSTSTGILKQKEIADSIHYIYILRTHILLGLLAILVGPFQFVAKIRLRYKSIHKKIGYVYALSVFTSAIAGFVVAQYAMGGWPTRIGFTLLSILWLTTIVAAIYYAKIGEFAGHKKWMYLNYSLTFASITQRTLLLLPLLTPISFMPIYQVSAWLPWMINLGLAFYFFKRSKSSNL